MRAKYRGVPLAVRQDVWYRCDGICEGPVKRVREGCTYRAERIGVCWNPATDPAHINPKRLGGAKGLDTADNILALCRSCHERFDDGGTYDRGEIPEQPGDAVSG